MARLYANENFPLPAVERLRALGHDVLTSREAGNAGRAVPDDEVLRFGTVSGRAVVTLNRRHFVRLHGTYADHRGIVVCSVDADFAALADRVHRAIAGIDVLDGRLIRVDRLPA